MRNETDIVGSIVERKSTDSNGKPVTISVILLLFLVGCNVQKGKIKDDNSVFQKQMEQPSEKPINYDNVELIATPKEVYSPKDLTSDEIRCGLIEGESNYFNMPSIAESTRSPEETLRCLKTIKSAYAFFLTFEYATIENEDNKYCEAMELLNESLGNLKYTAEYSFVAKSNKASALSIVNSIWYRSNMCMPRVRFQKIVSDYKNNCENSNMGNYPLVDSVHNQFLDIPESFDTVKWINCKYK